ncbi:hypothetical protein FRC00_001974 [Tulasnella sp. 408]|nr:hypothetical protein FRC00_001974 [Tulasnella sp. 408]
MIDEEKGFRRTPTLVQRGTSVTLLEPTALDQDEGDDEEKGEWLNDEYLGYYNVPFKGSVDALGLPGSIGIAVAAGVACTAGFSDSVLGDDSPESVQQRRQMVKLSAHAAGFFTVATTINICLQALYASPAFCKVLIKKLNHRPERRTRFKRWPSLDILRYFVAYMTVGAAFLGLGLHLTGTFLLMSAFASYVSLLPYQIAMGWVAFATVVGWKIAIVLEQPVARKKWEKILSGVSS